MARTTLGRGRIRRALHIGPGSRRERPAATSATQAGRSRAGSSAPRSARPTQGKRGLRAKARGPTARAVRFRHPHGIYVDDMPAPRIEDARDVVLDVTKTAICGSDLHIYNGLFPQLRPLTMGHEFMGTVREVGSKVSTLAVGDRVVVPFPIAGGGCWFCANGLPTACSESNPKYGPGGHLLREKGGGIFGYTDLYGGYAGGQAEQVRVPFADFGARKVPDGLSDEQVLFLGDIFPTGWTAIDWAQVGPDDTVAVFGCGPVGIMAQKAANLAGAREVIGIDPLAYRRELAERCSEVTTLDPRDDAIARIRELTQGRGADVVVDAVGMEPRRGVGARVSAVAHGQRGSMRVVRDCFEAVRRGGRVSIVGVYGTAYDNFPLHQQFDKGLQVSAGQAPVHKHIDHLLRLVEEGEVRLDDVITHRIPLEDAARGYRLFNGKKDGCLKVVMSPKP